MTPDSPINALVRQIVTTHATYADDLDNAEPINLDFTHGTEIPAADRTQLTRRLTELRHLINDLHHQINSRLHLLSPDLHPDPDQAPPAAKPNWTRLPNSDTALPPGD